MKEFWRQLKMAFTSGPYTNSTGPKYEVPKRSYSGWKITGQQPPRAEADIEERKLRLVNPAVRDAYEKYQIILKLNRK